MHSPARMTSLPPDTIQVKRKRGVEDGPVDFLRVEGHKRHRSVSGEAVWVYQRKQRAAPTDPSKMGAGPSLPIIQATQEGDENRRVLPLRQRQSLLTKAETRLNVPNEPGANDKSTNEQMRRFHLSISNSPRLAVGTSRKRGSTAVFVERTPKKAKETADSFSLGTLDDAPEQDEDQDLPTQQPPAVPTEGTTTAPSGDGQGPRKQVKYKRPGLRARIHHKPQLPPSLVNRNEAVDLDQLAKDMDAYTLSAISQNVAKMDQDSARIATRQSQSSSKKYKPKPPALRWAERHPEQAAAIKVAEEAQKAASMAMDTTADDTSDDDYVMETYERVPASRLRDQAVPVSRVGLLVFDTEPDMVEFFYGEEGDSDDDFPEDEENENSENYYTADYPDEDLPWDDEFDRNPYRFQTQNASDGEEFDETQYEDGFLDVVWEKSRPVDDAKDIY